MSIPSTYTDINETGCCAVPNVTEWDQVTIDFDAQPFIRMNTRCVMHVPLGMAKVMTALDASAREAGVTMPAGRGMVLSRDVSPWTAEQLYAVTAPVQGCDNLVLDGRFATCVFEGPYGRAESWASQAHEFARTQGSPGEATYFLYTTCPKCAKHYGKNYVIALVPLDAAA